MGCGQTLTIVAKRQRQSAMLSIHERAGDHVDASIRDNGARPVVSHRL